MTALDRRYDTQIHRRITRTVMVGDVAIGSDHPVVVQSMINEDTLDIDAAVAGIVRLAEAGSEIVRVTTPSMAHARAMGEIRAAVRARGCSVPLVADVHHNGVKIAMEVAQHVDKVRINPGLFVFDKPDRMLDLGFQDIIADLISKVKARVNDVGFNIAAGSLHPFASFPQLQPSPPAEG